MFITQKLIASLALLAIPAAAGPLLYVVNIAQQFGSVDAASGKFQQIGPGLPEGMDGLAAGPNGSLLGISYASNLYSINPATGISKFVGPTGLGDCTVPDASPCGPTSNLTLGASAGKVYATDFENRLYSVNPLTGAASLIGPTGIPAVPFIPGSLNPNGTLNFYDQALFDAEGTLYATFDAWVFDPATFAVASISVAPELFRIDTSTGLATFIGPTDLGIGAVAAVNGTYYALNNQAGNISSLNLTNGNTTFVSNFDPVGGTFFGAAAAPAPEPFSLALTGIGLAALGVCRRRRSLENIDDESAEPGVPAR